MNIFKNFKIATKLYIGFGIVLIILTLMSVITYMNFQSFSEANKWDKHTYKVLDKLDGVVECLINMETGQRGFMLTGNEASLEPYNSGKDNYEKIYNEVKELTSDNPKQQELLTNADKQVQEWMNIAIESIELRKQVAEGQATMDDVVKLEQEAKGKSAMDQFRDIIGDSSKMEEDLLVTRGEESVALEQNTKNVLVVGTIIAIILTIIISVWISKMISNPINKIKIIAEKISLGDTNVKVDIDSKDEIGNLANSFGLVLETLDNLTKEIKMLITASEDGKLSQRGNSSKFKGDWAEIINGLNGLLDKIIEPINEASDVLKEMSQGNLNILVNGEYKGDHAEIKKALNSTITNIKSYINEISEILTKVSKGNLTVNIERKYLGDFSEIKNSINMIIQSFNQILSNINVSAEQVANGSNQLSQSSQVLSQGSTEQASSIEEITSSIEEIATQTSDNDKNASQANDIALTSKEDAISGNKQMQEMLKSMGEINDASGNISKIIKVIDEIAFQTNILALNAAVEAARAGQHGKGFAVVAEEVRNLAARSANAAKETTSLIEGSINKVDIGTKIANDTAQALDKIVSGVAKVADIVGGIATASNEQANGIKQVNKAIEQVSKVVQTNSATAEESASSSEELSSQADLLKNMISKFKLDNGDYLKTENQDKKYSDRFNKNKEQNDILALSGTTTRPKINLEEDHEYGKY